MQFKALKRLQANFSYFNRISKNFTTNNSNTETIPKKKPFDGVKYISHNKNVFEIHLNNPKKLNSLDMKMIKSILKRVRPLLPENISSSDDDILGKTDKEIINKQISEMTEVPKIVLLTAEGDRSFCAGGDITTLFETQKKGGNLKPIKDFFRYEYLLDYTLTRIQPTLISIWNGYVMGGGVGISINSPIRIATENTTFAMPETAIGLFPDVGGTFFLPRIFNKDPSIGLYMGLTGKRLKGKDLAYAGVATHYVPKEKLNDLKTALIEQTGVDTNLEKIKQLIGSFSEVTYNPSLFTFPRLDDIKRVFVVDSLDEIFKRLNNLVETGSQSEKDWASNILKSFTKYSLISLVVVVEQIKRGINIKTIEEAFNLEAQLISAFVEDSDFFEGVRALLIDKDLKPNWKYKNLKEVPQNDIINKFFERAEEIDVDLDKDEKNENDPNK